MSDTSKRQARRTVARHGHLRAPNPLARLLRVLGLGLVCVLVAGFGTAAYAAWDLGSSFAQNSTDIHAGGTTPPDISELVGEKGVDLLLVGVDVCEWDSHEKFGDRCSSNPAHYGDDGRQLDAGLNDVNLLVHISPEPRKITAIAFPRDLMIPTPECTNPKTGSVTPASSYNMINNTYGAGGLACVVDTINTLTTPYDPDLAIDYAATVTWNGVIEITNALGGVEVCVGETINDVEAGMLYLEGGQTHNLAGEQALAFLRARKHIGDGSDLGRISNQQVYMSALARKLMSEETLTNPGTVLSLARTTLSNVDPSSNLTNPVTLVQIALAAKDVPLSDIVFLQYPVGADPYDPDNRVAPNQEAAAALFEAIAANQSLAPEQTDGSMGSAIDASQPTEEPTPGTEEQTPGTEEPTPGATDGGAPAAEVAAPGRTALDESCANPVG